MLKGEGLRCLWLARTIPLPLSTGDNVYTAWLAQALAAAGASVTFMGLLNSAASLRPAEAFERKIDWNVVPGRPNATAVALASPLPLVAARFDTRGYAQHLKAILRACDFDAVILDQYAMVWAIGHIKRSKSNSARSPIVYIAHNYEAKLAADIARDFHGNLFRKAALHANARKIANAERCLARAADILVTLTAEDAKSLAPLSPSAKLVLPPGYNGPHVPERQVVQATPRRVAIVGSFRWTPKQMNLAAFVEAADPILQNAGVGLDIVGEIPAPLQKACEARVKATRFHGFVDNLGEFLAARRMGLVVEETGGGFKLKALDYIFNRVPIAAIAGSMAGLPLTPGLDYLSFASMQELAQGIAAVIDDLERLNSLQQAAYEKCKTAFDWSDRGQALCNAIRQALNRQLQACAARPQ
ncbi:MAG: glycosyltransferase [Acidobacteria bacterium]|nr:glycosyltransferase [Acidobacteriota bacterium]